MLATAGLLALSGCTATGAGGADPARASSTILSNCGLDLSISGVPERAVTLEQGATETMLALGLQSHMVGTSYLTDAVAPEYEKAYEQVPVLAAQYPTTDALREAEPDFVYSMRASAFAPDAGGSRQELRDLGVPAYLSSNDCEDPSMIGSEASFNRIFAEVSDIAGIFGVTDRGDALIATQKDTLSQVTTEASSVGSPSIVWLYSSIDGSPIVAGSRGLADTMGTLAGATNAFSDLDAQWTETSWDEIAQRDPDVIVVADLSRGLAGDSAADKIAGLRSDPVTSNLAAVQRGHLVALPATELDPSVRSIHALQTLSADLVDFAKADR